MPTFPRATSAKPRLITMPRFPSALQSWAQGGKGQFRIVSNMGRQWEEVYPVLNTGLVSVRALLAAINQGVHEGTIWDVQHLYMLTRLGTGGGSPVVSGASQTGSNLNISGASNNITNWLRRGDIIKVVGCAVVMDVTADVNTGGTGLATIPISPAIYVGGSPANGAAVEINPANIFYKAVLVDVSALPAIDVTKQMQPGLTLTWREQPT